VTTDHQLTSVRRGRRRVVASSSLVALSFLIVASLNASGCRARSTSESDAAGIIVVNAPAAGEVRRVLVAEGAHVAEGAPIVEIAVRDETGGAAAQAQPTEDPQARAARGVTAAQGEVEAARAEVVRTQVEVQRLTPLVAAGQASQGELDGANALYNQAQQRFQRAQEAARGAQSGLIAARLPTATTPAAPSERIVAARATSAGVVSVLNARVGERVAAGQPLATLRADAQ
jgi:multidrug resistance efflux pump